jgi:hypothetical protein
MKYIILFFLMLTNISWSAEAVTDRKKSYALSALNHFEIFILFLTYEQMDKNLIYNSTVEAFKKYGRVTASEGQSLFENLLHRNDIDGPVCLFCLDKENDDTKVSLEVIAETEVELDKVKTATSIWKKTLNSKICSDNQSQSNVEITHLIEEMIDDFSKDWKIANQNSNPLIFHVNKFENL